MVTSNMPIISIIIPVYNVAAYLPTCIESVQNQSFKEIEILLVNDGSTDDSPQICDQYALGDSRIRVIHQKNRGVSCARNAGIDVAQGHYITFVDSDDWVAPDYLRLLYEALQNTPEASISFCEYYNVKDGVETINAPFNESRIYKANEAIGELYQDQKIKNYIWGKLYRKVLFENIRFPEDRSICEDMAILYLLFYAAGTIIHIPAPAYYYLTRSDSSLNSRYDVEKSYQYFLARTEMCLFIREKNILPEKKKRIHNEKNLFRYGIHLLNRLIRTKSLSANQQMVKDLFDKLQLFDNLTLNDIGLVYYLKRKLIYSNFPLYCRIYKIFRRK